MNIRPLFINNLVIWLNFKICFTLLYALYMVIFLHSKKHILQLIYNNIFRNLIICMKSISFYSSLLFISPLLLLLLFYEEKPNDKNKYINIAIADSFKIFNR